jgi:benzodiazapine receptor
VDTATVRQGGLLLFAQMVINLFWSIIFFGMPAIFFGLIAILVLFVLIASTSVAFLRISKPAALMLVPNLIWVGFASALNAMVWILK